MVEPSGDLKQKRHYMGEEQMKNKLIAALLVGLMLGGAAAADSGGNFVSTQSHWKHHVPVSTMPGQTMDMKYSPGQMVGVGYLTSAFAKNAGDPVMLESTSTESSTIVDVNNIQFDTDDTSISTGATDFGTSTINGKSARIGDATKNSLIVTSMRYNMPESFNVQHGTHVQSSASNEATVEVDSTVDAGDKTYRFEANFPFNDEDEASSPVPSDLISSNLYTSYENGLNFWFDISFSDTIITDDGFEYTGSLSYGTQA